jgi:hypothetical protein
MPAIVPRPRNANGMSTRPRTPGRRREGLGARNSSGVRSSSSALAIASGCLRPVGPSRWRSWPARCRSHIGASQNIRIVGLGHRRPHGSRHVRVAAVTLGLVIRDERL